ncbi:PAP/OAS1 substrate-binding domain-containing protein [Karstenula rhodostoma CBS 690.94]|uniref:polynucleotide adenylyltransferase n=1 Tax=Karstenula rhodostoma CBS 690.94 TaxID=1392251 RepID=A0A9P4PJ12_9PLEO|nr:PAP/OAS1 substrate-binding domain-containing protein [Karstenula rhodostoma CBS 690.94]
MAEQQAQGSLEDQLRSMILTNVTIGITPDSATGHMANQQQQNWRSRGRGRGRGRPYSNRGGTHWAGTEHQHRGFPAAPPEQNMAPQSTPRVLQRPYNPNGNTSNIAQSAGPSRPYAPHGQQPRRGQAMRSPYATSFNGGFQQHQVSDPTLQAAYLDHVASVEIPKAEIAKEEFEGKETFRQQLEAVCQKEFADKYTGDIASIKLVTFGSIASGFATPGSDMDLAIVPQWNDPSKSQETSIDRDIPRLLERAVLDVKMGGRLLTRTRVPILKVCQMPTEELYNALFEERQKWDQLPEEEQYALPAPPGVISHNPTELQEKVKSPQVNDSQSFPTLAEAKAAKGIVRSAPSVKVIEHGDDSKAEVAQAPATDGRKENNAPKETEDAVDPSKNQQPRGPRKWLREKKLGPLDFPKVGVGIQCDINFENPLAIHNTQLLRCYSLTDSRVRPMVLFVKAWAKRRKINSAYSGTLSSYGWVLMVLHYLVNMANPPVCPNLQSSWRPTTTKAEDLQQILQETTVSGYAVRFWHDEAAIAQLASAGQLSRNTQSIGELLRGFFHYYASIAQPSHYGQKHWSFFWATEVLSLRTPGGIRQKTEKGWTKATTTISNGKEVRQRYLFAIEDPFELDHNVARTVTHDGIVAIRDELRRAGRILNAVGRGQTPEGGLFDEVVEQAPPVTPNRTQAESETAPPLADTAGAGGSVVENELSTVAAVTGVPVPVAGTCEPGTHV